MLAPDPFVALYFSFLLERTPKAQPGEPRTCERTSARLTRLGSAHGLWPGAAASVTIVAAIAADSPEDEAASVRSASVHLAAVELDALVDTHESMAESVAPAVSMIGGNAAVDCHNSVPPANRTVPDGGRGFWHPTGARCGRAVSSCAATDETLDTVNRARMNEASQARRQGFSECQLTGADWRRD